MNYDWYFIINKTEFEALDIPSREVQLQLKEAGALKTFLITKGNLTSILVDGIFLSLDLNGEDPFEFEGFAIGSDEDENIYYGIAVEDE